MLSIMRQATVEPCVVFPAEAKDWLDRIGLSWQLLPASEVGCVIVFFGDERAAKFYARRWNGRMGREHRASRKAASV